VEVGKASRWERSTAGDKLDECLGRVEGGRERRELEGGRRKGEKEKRGDHSCIIGAEREMDRFQWHSQEYFTKAL